MKNYEKKHVHEVYENISKFFNYTRLYTWDWVKNFIDENYKIGDIVYDIGCGNGRNMRKNFIGIDTSINLTKICKTKGFNVLNSDMCNLPIRDNVVDIVICIASFHHLYTIERRCNALKELRRICNKNSVILISVWSKTQPKKTRRVFENYGNNLVLWKQGADVFERFYYIFKNDEILNLFRSCGFDVIKHSHICGNEIYILKIS
jgi:ubiquinone/menaquinone biosynthesis C-methylase UbiE